MRTRAALWIGVVALLGAGCAPGDPVERVLERRALWSVELLSTVQREDGSALAQFRLPGRSSGSWTR